SRVDKDGQRDTLFLDFAEEFDRVFHSKLHNKLKHIRNNDKILTWLEAYLFGRKQFVQLNSTMP
ncbi:hypothetical protein IscW_ISCW008449, partial [Ixodes scapularis]